MVLEVPVNSAQSKDEVNNVPSAGPGAFSVPDKRLHLLHIWGKWLTWLNTGLLLQLCLFWSLTPPETIKGDVTGSHNTRYVIKQSA